MSNTVQNAAQIAESALQDQASRLADREVFLCLSHMVSTLAQGTGLSFGDRHSMRRGHGSDLLSLAEQASELCAPIPDYEEAAIQAGWSNTGSTVECWRNEAEHSGWAMDSAQEVCEEFDIEPYDREVYEHWAVSTWLAEKLEAKGERVDTDFANLNVWARTTTGQAISMDAVIREITSELHSA